MNTQLLNSLPNLLYPAGDNHAVAVRELFGEGGSLTRPLSDGERKELAQLKLLLLVFSNRSGSTFLAELLGQAGLMNNPRAEPFNAQAVKKSRVELQIPTYTDYLLHLVRNYRTDQGTVGFKVSSSQLFDLARMGLLEGFGGVYLVQSARRDLLGQAISHFKARQTGRWMADAGSRSEQSGSPPYDGVDILRCLNMATQRRAHFLYFQSIHRLPAVDLFYEDVVADPVAAVGTVAKMMACEAVTDGIDAGQVSIQRQRDASSESYRERFIAEFALGDIDAS